MSKTTHPSVVAAATMLVVALPGATSAAICASNWGYGVAVGDVPEAPLPRNDKILQWDSSLGLRVRK